MSEDCVICRVLGEWLEVRDDEHTDAEPPPETARLEFLPGCSLLRCPICGTYYVTYEDTTYRSMPMFQPGWVRTREWRRVPMRLALRHLAREDGAGPWRDARYHAAIAELKAELEGDRLAGALDEGGRARVEAEEILAADRRRRRE